MAIRSRRPARARGAAREVTSRPIEANAVYSRAEAVALLRTSAAGLRREVEGGRVRVQWRDGKQLFLGKWLLEYLEAPSPAKG
jgi:hypothetical protein